MHLLQNFFSQKIYIILLIVFSTLCFANIPLFWRFDTLSSGYSAKFTWYPLIILSMYYLYLAYQGNWVCQEFCVNRFNKQHRIAA